jgi:hypothetical protein
MRRLSFQSIGWSKGEMGDAGCELDRFLLQEVTVYLSNNCEKLFSFYVSRFILSYQAVDPHGQARGTHGL